MAECGSPGGLNLGGNLLDLVLVVLSVLGFPSSCPCTGPPVFPGSCWFYWRVSSPTGALRGIPLWRFFLGMLTAEALS